MISNSNGNKFKKKITQIQPRNASKTAPLRAETAQPGIAAFVVAMRESLVTTTWCTEHPLPRSNNFNLMTTKRMKIDFKFKSKQIQKKNHTNSTKKCVENRPPEGRNRPARYSPWLQLSSQRAEMHLFDHRNQFRTIDFLAV